MTRAKAINRIEVAMLHGTAYIKDAAGVVQYVLDYDGYTKQFSLKSRDGLHWQTVVCTYNRDKVIELLVA